MISSKRIEEVFYKCMFGEDKVKDGSLIEGTPYITVEGVHTKVAFDPEKIEQYKDEIKSWVDDLDPRFNEEPDGGYSFIGVPFDKNGTQWGEQRDGDRLMMLAIAAGFVKYLFPRKFWPALPGSVPYYVIPKEPVEVKILEWTSKK